MALPKLSLCLRDAGGSRVPVGGVSDGELSANCSIAGAGGSVTDRIPPYLVLLMFKKGVKNMERTETRNNIPKVATDLPVVDCR